MKNMTTTPSPLTPNPESSAEVSAPRRLEWWETQQLERQGCSAADWSRVLVAPGSDLSRIRNVRFEGSVSVGVIREAELRDALIADSVVGDDATVRCVPGGVRGATVGPLSLIHI